MAIKTTPTPGESPEYVDQEVLGDFINALAEQNVTQITILDDTSGTGYWLVSWERS